MSVLPKLIYSPIKFKPYQNLNDLYWRIQKIHLKIHVNSQEILNSQNNSGKGKQSWRAHTSWFENIIKLQWASQVVLVLKNPPANAGVVRGTGSIPGSGTVSGGGHSNPFQYSCLENPMDKWAWKATVHRVAKSWTRLKQLSVYTDT